MSIKQPLVCIDVETTGLNPETDHILELAMVIPNLPPVNSVDDMYRQHVSFVINGDVRLCSLQVAKMHNQSGLFQDLKNGLGADLATVDQIASDWLTMRCGKNIWLSGRNPTFDLRFIEARMPKLFSVLHPYRTVCATSLDWLLVHAGVVLEPARQHRALPDATEAADVVERSVMLVS